MKVNGTAVIDDFFSRGGCSIVFSGGGEPLAYKPLYKKNETFGGKSLIQYCIDLGLTCGLITNGVNSVAIQAEIDIKKLAFLRISVDSLDHEKYTALHRCANNHFEKLIDNISYISEIKGKSPLPAFGVSFIVDRNSQLNFFKEDLEEIKRFATARNIDFVQFKHIHTNDSKQAEEDMRELHYKLSKMDWEDTEFWVQKYLAPMPDQECRVTEIIQSIGGANQRFPCCHLFGDSSHFRQENFEPKGKVVKNCQSRVCRYLSVNGVLNGIQNEDGKMAAIAKLSESLDEHGFHPYRLFPTAPDLYFPVSSRKNRVG